MINFIDDLIQDEQDKDNIKDTISIKNKKVKYQEAQVSVGDKMPNDKKDVCSYCNVEFTLRGLRAHKIKCGKLHIKNKQVIKSEPASKPATEQTPENQVIAPKEVESAPEVKIEAKESKPEPKPKPKPKKKVIKKESIKQESKPVPVSRKPADLFGKQPAEKQAEKQESKPESKKAEKESRERGLFKCYRGD